MYVGIDIGGTNTRLSTSDSLNNPLIENREMFPTSQNFKEGYLHITDYLNRLTDPIQGIGIALAGHIDFEKQLMIGTHNHLPDYVRKPLVDNLIDSYKTKVILDNDAIASALGESIYGQKDNKDFMYITWGTGVAIVLLHHKFGYAVSERLDRVTYFENWDLLFGGEGLHQRYGKKPTLFEFTEWEQIMEEFRPYLVQFIQKSNPNYVIFGGGLAIKQWSHIEKMTNTLSEDFKTKFDLTKLGEDVGLYGAFALLSQSRKK